MHPFQNGITDKKVEGQIREFVSELWILCIRYYRLEWKTYYFKLLFKIKMLFGPVHLLFHLGLNIPCPLEIRC